MGDSYFPGVFSLDDGPIEAVQTSETDPKIRLDADGLHATDATGAQVFDLDADTGTGFFKGRVTAQGLTLPPGANAGDPAVEHRVMWVRQSDGSRVAQIYTVSSADGQVATVDETNARDTVNGIGIKKLQALGPGVRRADIEMHTGSGVVEPYVKATAQGPFAGDGVTVIDGAGKSSFVRLQGSKRNMLAGPFAINFNIAPNTHAQWNMTVPDRGGWTATQVMGSTENVGGWSQYFIWTYIWVNNTTIQIQATDSNGSVPVNGWFRFMVLYLGA